MMKFEVKKDLNYILCYTRMHQEDMIYSSKLAYSMHLAYSKDGKKFHELNHNSGILFAKATENNNGSLNAKEKFSYLLQKIFYSIRKLV